jgi:hypothetical protein
MTQFGLQMDSTLTERSKGQKFLSEFNGNERSNSQSLSFNVCTCEEFYGSLILSLNKKDSPNRPSNVDELRLLEQKRLHYQIRASNNSPKHR